MGKTIYITLLGNMVIASETRDTHVNQLGEIVFTSVRDELARIDEAGDIRSNLRFRTVIAELKR